MKKPYITVAVVQKWIPDAKIETLVVAEHELPILKNVYATAEVQAGTSLVDGKAEKEFDPSNEYDRLKTEYLQCAETQEWRVDEVYLGNTIGCAATGIDAQFQAKIMPARTAVLAYYAGNPKVFAGADLRTALGLLPAVAAVTDFVPGVMQLEPTGYHGNDYVYDRGAEARYQNQLALGHI